MGKVIKITGSCEFSKGEIVEALRRKLANDTFMTLDIEEFEEQALNALRSRTPMFLPRTTSTLVLYNANKARKEGQKTLKAYCESPDPDKDVVLVTAHKGKVAKWFGSLPADKTLDFEATKPWDLPKWLIDRSKKRGYRLHKDLAEALVINVGEDLYDLDNELSKIFLFVGQRSEITVSDIQYTLYSRKADSPFEIASEWAKGKKPLALSLFSRHFENTPEPQWVRSEMVFLKAFLDLLAKLIRARSLRDKGAHASECARAFGVSKWLYENRIREAVQCRPLPALLQAYAKMAEIEVQAKSGKDGRLLLQQFMIQH